MTYYLLSHGGVQTLGKNITIAARIAVSQGNLVVNEHGKPVEPPIAQARLPETFYGRFM